MMEVAERFPLNGSIESAARKDRETWWQYSRTEFLYRNANPPDGRVGRGRHGVPSRPLGRQAGRRPNGSRRARRFCSMSAFSSCASASRSRSVRVRSSTQRFVERLDGGRRGVLPREARRRAGPGRRADCPGAGRLPADYRPSRRPGQPCRRRQGRAWSRRHATGMARGHCRVAASALQRRLAHAPRLVDVAPSGARQSGRMDPAHDSTSRKIPLVSDASARRRPPRAPSGRSGSTR